jgi:hypothetical protein
VETSSGTGTTFILTWDDWRGYTHSVPIPAIETVLDALRPTGTPRSAAPGSR